MCYFFSMHFKKYCMNIEKFVTVIFLCFATVYHETFCDIFSWIFHMFHILILGFHHHERDW